MEKIAYNKLIRDRIPEIIGAKGKQFEVQTLSQEAFEAALLTKVVEEASEVHSASSQDELVKELADLAEVVEALCQLKGITRLDIEKLQAQKRQERGGFEKRLLLVWSEKD